MTDFNKRISGRLEVWMVRCSLVPQLIHNGERHGNLEFDVPIDVWTARKAYSTLFRYKHLTNEYLRTLFDFTFGEMKPVKKKFFRRWWAK